MRKFVSVRGALMTLAIVAMGACEYETPNGQIPSDYVQYAQAVIGDYVGKLDGGTSGTLKIRMNGDKPKVTFSGRLLSCSGTIGELRSIDVSNDRLYWAKLQLSASCVEGRDIKLTFSEDYKTVSATVLESSREVERCPSVWQIQDCRDKADQAENRCDPEDAFYRQCIEDARREWQSCDECWTETVGDYIYGNFGR